MKRILTIAALSAAFWTAASAAQQAPPAEGAPPVATFSTDVEIVTLDVSVLDGRRLPVRGLTAADFTVLEEGEVRPVVAFKAVDLPDRHMYAAPWMRDVAADVVTNRWDAERVVVLLLDDFNVSPNPADVSATKEIARTIIDEMGPSDMAAVLYTFAHERRQEFTTDRGRLVAAVERFKSSAFPTITGVPSMACPHNECVTTALQAIATVLSEWPGRRKAIAYVSPEGGYSLGPQNIEQEAFEANASIWDSSRDLERTFRALQEANVNVYQYDPRGILSSTGLSVAGVVDIRSGINGLGMFADNSGGTIVKNSNAPWERVDEMFVENSSYYLLGIRPADSKSDGTFRRISVEVNGAGMEVRTRGGYYAPVVETPEEAPDTPAALLDTLMVGAVPTSDLPLTLSVVPFAAAGTPGSTVLVVAGVDRDAGPGASDVVEIAARAYDEATPDRRSRGVATARLELTPRPTATGTVHYDLATRLDLRPGRYEIRLAVNSAAAQAAGSAFMSVTVPDFTEEPLALSGVVLTRIPASRARGEDTLGELLPFTPTTARAFERTDRVVALLRLYQGGRFPAAGVTVTASLTDQTGREVFEEAARFAANEFEVRERPAEYRLELPLAQLEPGEYLLSIGAGTDAGEATAPRHVRLRVN